MVACTLWIPACIFLELIAVPLTSEGLQVQVWFVVFYKLVVLMMASTILIY